MFAFCLESEITLSGLSRFESIIGAASSTDNSGQFEDNSGRFEDNSGQFDAQLR